MYCNELKEFAQGQERKLINALTNTREHPSPDGETRSRDDYQWDCARILYSSSFRRLRGKVQLFEVDPERFNKSGLTHDLEIAQIARNITSGLRPINPVVVELAALAHGIGNPPSDRSGEKLLSKLSEEIGGYEGNVQALRILRKLEKKFSYCSGLNLTRHSLLSAVEYPIPRAAATISKFIYDDNCYFYINLLTENQLDLNPGEKTIDAQIMDLADEVAYATHDLEDALSRDIATVEDIEYEFQISNEFRGVREQFRETVTQSRNITFQANLLKTSEELAIIFCRELTSNIVSRLVTGISIVTNLNDFQELRLGKLNALSEGLKKLLFKVTMRKRNILTYEFRGNKIIRDLCDFYSEGKNYKFLPPELKFTLPQPDSCIFKISKKRVVVDYISGMMDTFAVKEWGTHCLK